MNWKMATSRQANQLSLFNGGIKMISDQRREYMREWRAKNKAHIREYQENYRNEHREESREYARARYHANVEYERARCRAYKKTNKDVCEALRKKYLKRTGRAQPKVMSALSSGRLQKEPCEICGRDAEAHHDNYNYPLQVRWLCRKHHAEWHRNNTPIYCSEVESK